MIPIEAIGNYKPAADHVNHFLQEVMVDIIRNANNIEETGLNYHKVNPKDPVFISRIATFFPADFDRTGMGESFLDLFALIIDTEFHRLNIVEEYALYKLIECSLKKTKKYVFPAELKDKISNDLIEQYHLPRNEVHHILFLIQDINSYLEICFDDWDMLLLDEYNFESLKSPKNEDMVKYLGISLDIQHYGPTWESFLKSLVTD